MKKFQSEHSCSPNRRSCSNTFQSSPKICPKLFRLEMQKECTNIAAGQNKTKDKNKKDSVVISVTRCLNYFAIFGHSQQRTIAIKEY